MTMNLMEIWPLCYLLDGLDHDEVGLKLIQAIRVLGVRIISITLYQHN